jgi:hypothetical protein
MRLLRCLFESSLTSSKPLAQNGLAASSSTHNSRAGFFTFTIPTPHVTSGWFLPQDSAFGTLCKDFDTRMTRPPQSPMGSPPLMHLLSSTAVKLSKRTLCERKYIGDSVLELCGEGDGWW